MAYSVIPTERFRRAVKRLAKKYPSLLADMEMLEDQLIGDPHLGVSLGSNIYKVRLSIKSKGKGKSGGARVITYLVDRQERIYLLTMYDKGETETISTDELRAFIREID